MEPASTCLEGRGLTRGVDGIRVCAPSADPSSQRLEVVHLQTPGDSLTRSLRGSRVDGRLQDLPLHRLQAQSLPFDWLHRFDLGIVETIRSIELLTCHGPDCLDSVWSN